MHELKTGPASVSGQSAVIRAGDKPKADLQAQPATIRATVHVTRAGIGKVDTFEIVATPEQPAPEPPKES